MDTNAVKALAERFGPAIYRLAYARTGNRQDAEDLMQEVFLCLLRKGPDRFRDQNHAKAWLLRVTIQRANNLYRSACRRREVPLEAAAEIKSTDPEALGAVEAVQALPPKLRLVTHLFYYEGLSVAEIARTLGVSQGAVKTRLSRAREKLRYILTERGEAYV